MRLGVRTVDAMGAALRESELGGPLCFRQLNLGNNKYHKYPTSLCPVSAITGERVTNDFREVLPFILALIVVLLMISYWPSLVPLVPNALMGN
jgi:hypothetical protein